MVTLIGHVSVCHMSCDALQVLVCNGCHECDDHTDEYNCTASRDQDDLRRDDLRCPTDSGRIYSNYFVLLYLCTNVPSVLLAIVLMY